MLSSYSVNHFSVQNLNGEREFDRSFTSRDRVYPSQCSVSLLSEPSRILPVIFTGSYQFRYLCCREWIKDDRESERIRELPLRSSLTTHGLQCCRDLHDNGFNGTLPKEISRLSNLLIMWGILYCCIAKWFVCWSRPPFSYLKCSALHGFSTEVLNVRIFAPQRFERQSFWRPISDLFYTQCQDSIASVQTCPESLWGRHTAKCFPKHDRITHNVSSGTHHHPKFYASKLLRVFVYYLVIKSLLVFRCSELLRLRDVAGDFSIVN